MKKNEEKVLTYDKNEMSKRFIKYHKIIQVFEGLFLAAIIGIILVVIIFGGMILFGKKETLRNDWKIADDIIDMSYVIDDSENKNVDEESKIMLGWLRTRLEDIEQNQPDKADTYEIIFIIISGVVYVSRLVLIILIFEKLSKIFKNSAENQTPFLSENVKCMKKTEIYFFILWALCFDIFSITGWIALLITEALTYIFKAGYELQKESDELL